MIDWLYRNVLLPAFETGFKRRHTYRYWRALEQSQWRPRGELEKLQLVGLRRLLSHAFANCPYYREAWLHEGLDPAQVETLADFQSWPVIHGDTIRANRPRMRAAGIKLLSKATGGSSGAPLHFDLDHMSLAKRTAAWHRGYSWAGAYPGSKQLYLWGVPVAAGPRPRWRQWKDALYHRLQRRLLLSTFELSEERVPHYCQQLNRYRPDAIVAYTSALYAFARSLRDRRLVPYSPKAMIVGAEKLHDFQRELIEGVFRAPLFETYGCREVMLIGAECDRHQGLHLTMENLLVEILDDEGRPTPSGEEGNVVVTDLFNYGMPFIRYANGDRAVAGFASCPCGRGLPLLRQVVGRQADIIQTPDGRHIPGLFFPHLLKEYPAITRFQAVQDKLDHIQLRVVLGKRLSETDRQSLEQQVCRVLGPLVQFDFLPVDAIPLTAAGKLQVFVNRVPPAQREAAYERLAPVH